MATTFSISPPASDAIVANGIGVLAIVVAVLAVWIFARGNRRRALALATYCAATLTVSEQLARAGVLTRFDRMPPPMLLLLVAVLGGALAAGLSRFGRGVATDLSFAALIGFQSFRLPLELVMHRAAERGIMPVELSYSGYNFDIATGAGALLIAVLLAAGVRVPRAAIWIWNLWGLYCLVAIAIVAIAALPHLRAFGDDPASVNTWVLFVPYVWLPTILVPAALFGHVVITRKLLAK